MLCDICKKNEATIHYKEFVGGQQKSLNVCVECAREHEKTSGLNFGAFNLAEMLCNLGNFAKKNSGDAPAKETSGGTLTCTRCGRTLQQLRKSGGKLGCADCYTVFKEVLDDAISRVQKGKTHVGKHPGARRSGGAAEKTAKLIRLKKDLAELIQMENYEKAALVRDEIRALEKPAPARKKRATEEA